MYFSDQELDGLLLEDIYRGDLTTQALGIGNQGAEIQFKRKQAGIVAGVDIVKRLCHKLELMPVCYVNDGDWASSGQLLLSAHGKADKVHQVWKVAQLVLEWCSGVAQYTAEMCQNAQKVNSKAVVACTRKSIPYTRKLAAYAVLIGGGHIHRQV